VTGDELVRARRELDAASHLADGGFAAQAISRAYYAAFYAAEAALSEIGETRSKHAGVVSALGELLVKTGELAPDDGRLLRSLFDRRAGADYDIDDEPSAEDAASAIADARIIVDDVAAWLAARG
jgi:uncharacterized protein